jgi:hypothetical protein
MFSAAALFTIEKNHGTFLLWEIKTQIPRFEKTRWGNPSTRGLRWKELRVQSHPGLHSESLSQKYQNSNNRRDKNLSVPSFWGKVFYGTVLP